MLNGRWNNADARIQKCIFTFICKTWNVSTIQRSKCSDSQSYQLTLLCTHPELRWRKCKRVTFLNWINEDTCDPLHAYLSSTYYGPGTILGEINAKYRYKWHDYWFNNFKFYISKSLDVFIKVIKNQSVIQWDSGCKGTIQKAWNLNKTKELCQSEIH